MLVELDISTVRTSHAQVDPSVEGDRGGPGRDRGPRRPGRLRRQPGGAARPDNRITVWSQENLPPRMAATSKIIDRFEKQTGIKVDLVGVDEGQLPQLIMSAAAAGKLPDVIGAVPMGQVWQMYSNGLLNTRGQPRDRRQPRPEHVQRATPCELTSRRRHAAGVPSDAWLQLLVYRKDLLAQAGLPVPDTYAEAARRPPRRSTPRAVTASRSATDPGDVFTQQSFENLALANGCQLVDEQGRGRLDSPACETAFASVRQARPHLRSPRHPDRRLHPGHLLRRARSSMIVWSSFLLDELAGLRNDALPSCSAVQEGQGLPVRQQRHRHGAQGARRRRARPVRRDHVLGGHPDRGDGGLQEVRRVHDEQRLRGLDRHGARGQDPRPPGHRRRPGPLRARLACQRGRRRHPQAHERGVLRGAAGPTDRRASAT